jgi:hypothetical protein
MTPRMGTFVSLSVGGFLGVVASACHRAGQLLKNRLCAHNPRIDRSRGVSSANLPLPDYGRVARDLSTIGGTRATWP